jgi:hypothetical protein
MKLNADFEGRKSSLITYVIMFWELSATSGERALFFSGIFVHLFLHICIMKSSASVHRYTKFLLLLPLLFFIPRIKYSSFFLVSWYGVWDWVHLVRRPITGLLYQPRMIDDDECAAVGGMRIGRGNRNTWRRPPWIPLCSPQIPQYLTWARTRAAAVGSRRLTAWAMARPLYSSLPLIVIDKYFKRLYDSSMEDSSLHILEA